MKKGRFRDIVVAGIIAGVFLACSGGAMDAAGKLLTDGGELLSDAGRALRDAGQRLGEDAGQVLSDAGRSLTDAGESVLNDAGRSLMDAGGQILTDAGHLMKDAGGSAVDAADAMLGDASAQSCGVCSPGGFQQVVTADTDWDQMQGGTLEGDGWTKLYKDFSCTTYGTCDAYYFYKELLYGPFVLTDVVPIYGTVTFFAVGQADDCFDMLDIQVGPSTYEPVWRIPGESRTLVTSSTRFQSARIMVQADEKLCAFATASENEALSGPPLTPSVSAEEKVLWSGFRPYQ